MHHMTPPSGHWFCTVINYTVFSSTLCSTLLITSMTFDKFYSILKPLRAESFNTTNRANITISCIVTFSFTFNIPHWFFTAALGEDCRPYHRFMEEWYNTSYFWVSMALNYIVPFCCLLVMNSCIIHTIRKSLKENIQRKNSLFDTSKERSKHENSCDCTPGQIHQLKGNIPRLKNSEKQIYIILLLVTFAFLILSTPSYAFFFYTRVVEFIPTPYSLGIFYLCQQIAHKTFFVNSSINFFLYVLSGSKFREDVKKLCDCCGSQDEAESSSVGNISEQSI